MMKKQSFEEKSGNSFNRFEKAVKQMLSVPKKEIYKREAEYQRTKRRPRTAADCYQSASASPPIIA